MNGLGDALNATFDQLLAAHQPRILRAALGLLADEQEAREVAQEALTRAWAARDRYQAGRPFYPWLYTIVKNACRDARARGRHRAVAGLEAERLPGTGRSPHAHAVAAQQRRRLAAALGGLAPDHREILSMRHFQGLTYAEIGDLLDLPQGTVMSRLYRARKALVQALEALP